jgi:hypothetical protein
MSSLGKIEIICESGLETPVVHDVNFGTDPMEDTND